MRRERRNRKAWVGIYAFNEASIALHERPGFIGERPLRRTTCTGGRLHDQFPYGLLREEREATLEVGH